MFLVEDYFWTRSSFFILHYDFWILFFFLFFRNFLKIHQTRQRRYEEAEWLFLSPPRRAVWKEGKERNSTVFPSEYDSTYEHLRARDAICIPNILTRIYIEFWTNILSAMQAASKSRNHLRNEKTLEIDSETCFEGLPALARSESCWPQGPGLRVGRNGPVWRLAAMARSEDWPQWPGLWVGRNGSVLQNKIDFRICCQSISNPHLITLI